MLLYQRFPFILFFLFDSIDLGICSFIGNSSHLLCFPFIVSSFVSVPTSLPTNLIMKALNFFCMLSGQIVLLLTMSKRYFNSISFWNVACLWNILIMLYTTAFYTQAFPCYPYTFHWVSEKLTVESKVNKYFKSHEIV